MDIVFENQAIYLINKPAGVSTQDDATEGISICSYFNLPYVINRLDKRVSGLVILAKNASSAKQYTELLPQIKKKYHCVVAKHPGEEEGSLVHWLKKEGSKSKVYSQEVNGSKQAELRYKVLQKSERYFLLEIELITGRFHQIRSQLAFIGCPIVGDVKYGYKRTTSDGSIFLCCTSFCIQNEIYTINWPDLWNKYGFEYSSF